jgi:hypothetical protein
MFTAFLICPVDKQLNCFDGNLRLGFFGARPEMRRAENARHAKQRAIGAWFFGVDIERDAADLARLQAFHQRGFVVDAAAGRVDQPHSRLQALELRDVDQVAGLFSQRRVDREVIDVRQHVVDLLVPLDAELLRLLLRHERVVPEHSHLKGLGPLHYREANAAKADDAERFAGDLRAHVLIAVPFAGLQAFISRSDVPRKGEHESYCVLSSA